MNQDCWEKYQELQICHDIILIAESKEELKNLLMRVKEKSEKDEKAFRKLRSWHPAPSLYVDAETMETVKEFIFLSSKITADSD